MISYDKKFLLLPENTICGGPCTWSEDICHAFILRMQAQFYSCTTESAWLFQILEVALHLPVSSKKVPGKCLIIKISFSNNGYMTTFRNVSQHNDHRWNMGV